jgi:hypothetical protein
MEVEIEIEQEEEIQLYRPEKAQFCQNKLDENIKFFIKSGEFNNRFSSFVSLKDSLKKSSLASKFENELSSFSSNIYTTNDFNNTVITHNFDDYYLARPKWLAMNKNKTKLVFISSYEANNYFHDFNDDCYLIMLMPVFRENQKRMFTSKPIEINEDLMQEILIYSGSFYFNSIKEQESFLNFICYVPTPRTQEHNEYFENFKIEENGFVLVENRKEVFGNRSMSERKCDIFKQDPSKFIIELISVRNYQLVPNSAHHLTIFNNGKKPLVDCVSN